MKFLTTLLSISFLALLSGCATDMSAGYHSGYGPRGHVGVGVHGHGNGAAVVGALIVGGIIGNAIAESEKKKNADTSVPKSEYKNPSRKSADEIANGYPIQQNAPGKQQQSQDQRTFNENQKEVQWYQVGKDGNCYLMGVNNGITDVISAVPGKKCHR